MTLHLLKLNEGKTEALAVHPFYGQCKLVNEIRFNETVIETNSFAKSLGVYFDSKLSFEKQVNETTRV